LWRHRAQANCSGASRFGFGHLVAVSRARPELAKSFAEEFGARKWFGTWQELLSDSEVDAVYVATPVHLHAEQTIAAAEAGKQVLCEKPLAMNPGNAIE
jgi:predicted dehydrogenase